MSARPPCQWCGLRVRQIDIPHLAMEQCVKDLRGALMAVAHDAKALTAQAEVNAGAASGMRRVIWLLVRRTGGTVLLSKAELVGMPQAAELALRETPEGMEIAAGEKVV
jgi:hypothetical protein